MVGYENKDEHILSTTDDETIKQSELFKAWVDVLKNNQDYFRLAIGAVIANNMRQAVREKTGFSCSAGVGPNKVSLNHSSMNICDVPFKFTGKYQ